MRKIIQIVDCPDTHSSEGSILGLCDDGTLWYFQCNKWTLINVPIPQDEIDLSPHEKPFGASSQQ